MGCNLGTNLGSNLGGNPGCNLCTKLGINLGGNLGSSLSRLHSWVYSQAAAEVATWLGTDRPLADTN